MKALINFETLPNGMPMVLHEDVADGRYRDKPVKLSRTIDSSVMYIQYDGTVYKVTAVDIIMGVLGTKNG